MSELAPNNANYTKMHPDAVEDINLAYEMAKAGDAERSRAATARRAAHTVLNLVMDQSHPSALRQRIEQNLTPTEAIRQEVNQTLTSMKNVEVEASQAGIELQPDAKRYLEDTELAAHAVNTIIDAPTAMEGLRQLGEKEDYQADYAEEAAQRRVLQERYEKSKSEHLAS